MVALGPDSTAIASPPVEFARDIRPILADKCLTCHGTDEAKRITSLRFDTETGAFARLARGGYAIVPGDPTRSQMYVRVSSADRTIRMPPSYMGHDRLKEEEIDLIRRWIEEGAKWQDHWAFIPVERPTIPDVANTGWPLGALDHFILARLEHEDLEPSLQAERTALVRRLSLDLTGLPPTPGEVDAFLADDSSLAYEKVVDRLLASPHFGERMAFPWLEAARYADTHGYQNDQPRSMWRWRDWVIEAFNRNMPFDQFTIEQVAGDLLPGATRAQRIATGFNRNHRGNAEGGIVPEEYAVEYVIDRVDTTATVWLGLTMGCARCHDHKYDPITQKEFYQFSAYFNNVPDRGRYFKYGNQPPFVAAPTGEQESQLEKLDARIRELQRLFDRLEGDSDGARNRWEERLSQSEERTNWSYDRGLTVRFPLDGEEAEFRDGPRTLVGGRLGQAALLEGTTYIEAGDFANLGFYDKFTLSAWIRPQRPTGGIVARYKAHFNSRADKGYGLFLVDGKLQMRLDAADIDDLVQVETTETVKMDRWQHVLATYDGSRLAKGIQLYVDGHPQNLKVIIDHSNNDIKLDEEPLRFGLGPNPEDRFQGLIDDVRVYDRALAPRQAAVVADAENLEEIARKDQHQRTQAQKDKLDLAFLTDYAPSPLRTAWGRLETLTLERKQLVESFPTVMVMEEMNPPRQTFVLNRGAYDAPGETVSAGLPGMLPPMPVGQPNNRLGLARWLVERSNPLTARVTVNRFWQMLFGQGLVRTLENFGLQGDWPTHSKLLDWLATEFMESNWDVKGILKTIVMSATYRQSSRAPAISLERDPENLLLTRGPRIRLPAEAIRDQALAAGGLLNRTIGGPSVRPYQPDGLWREVSNAGTYEHDAGPALYRRSLYTHWKRTIGPPAMLTFDAAARETCVVTKSRTNTPLQALNLMNDVTYSEISRIMAERMIKEGGDHASDRVSFGFRLATARFPRPEEVEILSNSFQRYRERYLSRPQDAQLYLDHGEYPRDKMLDVSELAAYTAVASLILNLDETITKE